MPNPKPAKQSTLLAISEAAMRLRDVVSLLEMIKTAVAIDVVPMALLPEVAPRVDGAMAAATYARDTVKAYYEGDVEQILRDREFELQIAGLAEDKRNRKD